MTCNSISGFLFSWRNLPRNLPYSPLAYQPVRFKNAGGLSSGEKAFQDAFTPSTSAYTLKLPIDVEESTEQGTLIPRIDIQHAGRASVIGRREYNEDRLMMSRLTPHLLLFGIFDGHGSAAAADFANQVMPRCALFQLAVLRSRLSAAKQSIVAVPPSHLEDVLQKTFLMVNNLMARHFLYYGTDHDRQWSGTTATVALLRHSYQLVIAHVGDSRALLCRSGSIEPLTVDHKPESLVRASSQSEEEPTEAERVVKCGGRIFVNSLGIPLVNGRLGMTRSLGDAPLKPFGVTARADTTNLRIRHSRISFLALVSDGVSHVMSDADVLEAVSCCRTPNEAAQQVVETALLYGSEDNVSAIIVPFGSWGKQFNETRKTHRISHMKFQH